MKLLQKVPTPRFLRHSVVSIFILQDLFRWCHNWWWWSW